MTDNNTINLRKLQIGDRARIVSIDGQGELMRRMRDMGLVPGSEIKIIGRAPLKDPVALRVKDFTLTLRNNEADHITVEVLQA